MLGKTFLKSLNSQVFSPSQVVEMFDPILLKLYNQLNDFNKKDHNDFMVKLDKLILQDSGKIN